METISKWRSGLRIKLLLLGAVPLLLLLLISYWSISKLNFLQTTTVHQFNERTDLVRLSGQMNSSINSMGRWLWLTYASKQDESGRKKFIGFAVKEIEKFDEAAASYMAMEKNNDLNSELKKILDEWKLAKAGVLEGLTYYEKGTDADFEAGKKYILTNATPHLVPITQDIQTLIAKIKQDSEKEIEIQTKETKDNIRVLIFIAIAACFWTVLFTIMIARKLVKIFSSLSASLTKSSENVGTTSAHIASISYELSETATAQASALEQISASLEQVTAMVGKNTENSKRSAHESSQASIRAQQGQEVAEKLLTSIEEIDESNKELINQVNVSNDKFNDIVRVIKEIESKTKVINEIVFQTKLLSFNASVEAARAGENGKGFAVVAEEVGKLAQMSGNASTEISNMLTQSIGHVESIIGQTRSQVNLCVEVGKEKVESGLTIAHECKSVIGEIKQTIETASQVAIEISEASEEQRMGVDEILKAVNQLDHVSQKNTQTSEQASRTAKELEQYADNVTKDVNTFMYTVDGGSLKIARFPWSEKLMLKVPDMDNQHKDLVQKMDKFFFCLDHSSLEETKIAFKALAESTVYHFQEEEKFLGTIHYPNLEKHKKIHSDLVKTVLEFGDQLNQGRIDKYQVADFLKNWLSLHIMGQDQHYSRFYHDKSFH